MESRHGRKKEQAESPEVLKAREEKEAVLVREYLALKDSLKELIESNKRDNDALKVTTALLRKSPDYYTIWNVRRTILKEGFLDNADDETANKIYTGELEFVQENLKLNPKSYWMWNHRRWCLESMSQPRWDKELAMVGKFLEMDARNFHGWDYRRYIIRQLDLKDKEAKDKVLERAQSEFDFTTTKIHQNFSNYSAWHNRSTLLGKLAEDLSAEEREATVDNEFDLVKNAIYTDPEDQSAWLYELWLIGRGMTPLKAGYVANIYKAQLTNTDLLKTIEERSISILGAYVISFHPLEIVVAFDETIEMRNPFTVSTRVEHVAIPLEGEWKATGSDSELGSLWIFQQAPGAVYGPTVEVVIFSDDVCAVRAGSKLPAAVCYELETLNQNLEDISGRLGRLVIGQNLMYDVTKRIGPVTRPDGTLETQVVNPKHRVTSLTESNSLDDRVALLKREISAVRELVELEPDCKWPIQILSTLLSELRKTISIHSTQAKLIDDECIELQEKLITIDPLRQERYEDRRTQLVFDRETLSIIQDSKRFPEIEFAVKQPSNLDLSMRGLTHIPISSYLLHLHTLNLDSNSITSTRFLRNLLNVRRVNLSNNLIERLEGLQHAPSLEFLTLENNMIAKWEDVVAGFVFWGEGKLGRTGGHVKVLLGNNPVVVNEGGEYVLEKRWEDVGEVGVEIQWQSEELRLAEEAILAAGGEI
ncbi:Rab geranylgeranyltransferase, partial [Linnemannia schmuckeri]